MGRYVATGVDKLIKAIKIIGFIAFILSINFGRQVYQQAKIAEEFMQLSINCEAQSQESCKKLTQETDFLLRMWNGDLSNNFLVVLLLWSIYGASSVYTASKSIRKAT